MTPKTASINSVVHGNYQGLNVGKMLNEKRDQVLAEEGYFYKSGGIYSSNVGQINRLARNGWRETSTAASEQGELRYFWKALDARFANQPPRERERG